MSSLGEARAAGLKSFVDHRTRINILTYLVLFHPVPIYIIWLTIIYTIKNIVNYVIYVIYPSFALSGFSPGTLGRHDIQHNDILINGTRHKNTISSAIMLCPNTECRV